MHNLTTGIFRCRCICSINKHRSPPVLDAMLVLKNPGFACPVIVVLQGFPAAFLYGYFFIGNFTGVGQDIKSLLANILFIERSIVKIIAAKKISHQRQYED